MSHGAVASQVLGVEVVNAVLADWRTAPVDAKVRTTLALLDQLTLAPETVGPDDLRPLRVAGVRDAAIEDAINVCALFSILDRLADAFGFAVPSSASVVRAAALLLRRGYR